MTVLLEKFDLKNLNLNWSCLIEAHPWPLPKIPDASCKHQGKISFIDAEGQIYFQTDENVEAVNAMTKILNQRNSRLRPMLHPNNWAIGDQAIGNNNFFININIYKLKLQFKNPEMKETGVEASSPTFFVLNSSKFYMLTMAKNWLLILEFINAVLIWSLKMCQFKLSDANLKMLCPKMTSIPWPLSVKFKGNLLAKKLKFESLASMWSTFLYLSYSTSWTKDRTQFCP